MKMHLLLLGCNVELLQLVLINDLMVLNTIRDESCMYQYEYD